MKRSEVLDRYRVSLDEFLSVASCPATADKVDRYIARLSNDDLKRLAMVMDVMHHVGHQVLPIIAKTLQVRQIDAGSLKPDSIVGRVVA